MARPAHLAATRHLIAQGHRRIAFLAWPEKSQTGYYRLQGYLDGMAEAGLPADPDWVQLAGNFYDESYAAAQRLLALPPDRRPSAIVASSDLMALGVLNAGWDAGLEVGRELAVVGFDDAPIARYLRPALTTLAQPIVEIGEQSGDHADRRDQRPARPAAPSVTAPCADRARIKRHMRLFRHTLAAYIRKALMELRAVIFDLDGVITDTAEFHYRSWQRLADEEGMRFSREINERLRGVSRRASLEIMLAENDRAASEEQIAEWMERKNDAITWRCSTRSRRPTCCLAQSLSSRNCARPASRPRWAQPARTLSRCSIAWLSPICWT